MNIKKQLAARVLKTSPQKVRFASDALGDIAKAITRSDIRGLIAIGKVMKITPPEQSRARARKIAGQKRKGHRRGTGSRKGGKHSTVSRKQTWVRRIRVQREFLNELRVKKLISPVNYRALYAKSGGGFFRNKRHIKLYMTERALFETKPIGVKEAVGGGSGSENVDSGTRTNVGKERY